ncbi:glycosyl transferase [candidate division WWE3 bacterium CG_4_9_14_0_2_um_filter_35_11]|uniref:Glycosyl transferase n=1 Tax=candidate division WWE3 bacterium CG_4_9_14_0_2_um_filter_35_11 TaxID=1975077 RepID=A0A2M8EMF5_UNCKA|nr:MAG: glycosyl transferase [candidate division WWE3 bacterium CG10_big_fil_rev_8_21_14_0_10_35_32]PJC23908.1 MAG: glycosyl transferase [candidate division WWE3 bacterium CG_4_9_14_0_2_um_filter_35_11]
MQDTKPLVSIIIICENWNNFLSESLPYYSKLDYPNFEVFVFMTEKPSKSVIEKFPKIKFITSAETKNKPAEKRDLAIKYADGSFFAFIDDDAFPHKDWLKNAVEILQDKEVVAIGGPGVTPRRVAPEQTSGATLLEHASGWVSASPLGGFGSTYRFIPQERREVDDFPSMNLIVRAEDFKKIGGFDSSFYPGEDTKFCLDLTQKLHKKIIYDPKVLVYHHKRPLFKKHLIQNGRYGLHRGHFARILPKTSRRWFYFIPSIFALGVITGNIATIISEYTKSTALIDIYATIFQFFFGIYIFMLFINATWVFGKSKTLYIAFLTIPGVFLTHLWYGIKFIQGFIKPKMEDKYGRAE